MNFCNIKQFIIVELVEFQQKFIEVILQEYYKYFVLN